MSKPTNKRESCKLNEKEKDTSSKIVVWCVRCPPRTVWQGHRRVAQHSPRFQPNHTTPPTTTETHIPSPPQQATKSNQAKPHQKHTQHKTTPTKPSKPICSYLSCCFSDSPAASLPNCSITQQHIQMNAQTLKKMLLPSPSPSSWACLGDVKINKQEGTLQAK